MASLRAKPQLAVVASSLPQHVLLSKETDNNGIDYSTTNNNNNNTTMFVQHASDISEKDARDNDDDDYDDATRSTSTDTVDFGSGVFTDELKSYMKAQLSEVEESTELNSYMKAQLLEPKSTASEVEVEGGVEGARQSDAPSIAAKERQSNDDNDVLLVSGEGNVYGYENIVDTLVTKFRTCSLDTISTKISEFERRLQHSPFSAAVLFKGQTVLAVNNLWELMCGYSSTEVRYLFFFLIYF